MSKFSAFLLAVVVALVVGGSVLVVAGDKETTALPKSFRAVVTDPVAHTPMGHPSYRLPKLESLLKKHRAEGYAPMGFERLEDGRFLIILEER